MATVWLVYREANPHYGGTKLVGIYLTKEIAQETANSLIGFQNSVREVEVHEKKEDFSEKWKDKTWY